MKKKIVVVKQDGVKDCGVSSLLSIIKYYGGNINIEKLREMTKTNKSGTTAFHLIECAEKIGFISKGIKCKNIDDLKTKINEPFIAHVIINKSYKHYIVVYNVDYKKCVVTVMDPASGIKKLSFDEFNTIWSKVIITFTPVKKLPIFKNNKDIFNLIKHIILSNKKIFINIIILSLFITLFNIINSYYFKIIIDDIVSNSLSNFYRISIVFLAIIIIKAISDYFRNQSLLYINQKIDFLLIRKAFSHIINLPYDYFKNKTTGEITSRISDLNYIKEMISKATITIFVDMLLFFVSSIILFSISRNLFMITIIIFILYVIVVAIFSPIFRKKIVATQERQASVNTHIIESINGFESIKGLNLQSNIVNKLENKYIKFLNKEYSMNRSYNIQLVFKDLIEGVGVLTILFVGYLLAVKGKISIGEVITYNSLLIYFLNPIKNVLELEPLIRYAISSFNRINELFSIDKENLLIDEKYTGKKIKGEIKFKNYCYTINDKDEILKNINLDIKVGEKVMIVGPSGCGKSTLIRAILNYSTNTNNSIFIDKKDIVNYNLKELRNNITYVSQNETLFNDSIYNNINLNNNLEYEQFLELTKLTEVDKICNKKSLGYNFLLEENGFNISGGEKGRIVLCRALTENNNVILLDEALRELDVNMERRILKRLFSAMKNKTIIVVSHRLENMDLFDKVIKMNNGTIDKIMKRADTYHG